MQIYYYIYYSLLIISFLCYLKYGRNNEQLLPIGILVLISIITEGLVEWRIQANKPYYYFYHFYGPIEYLFFSMFYLKVIKNKTLKVCIYLSIPIFLIVSLLISFNYIKLDGYQGMNTIIRGTLLILWSIIALFNLPYEEDVSIFKLPAFWIILGVLFFYGGVFFINGVYNGLLKKYPLEKEFYNKIHSIINLAFNYFLYIMISIGILCSMQKKK